MTSRDKGLPGEEQARAEIPQAEGSGEKADTLLPSRPDWLDSRDAGEGALLRADHAPTPSKFGRFILMDELGHGGMGVVYRALDPLLGREVALKVIRGATAATAERRARLLREASAMARLRHPGVVEVFEVNEQDGQPYFTMRLIEGPTLASAIAKDRFSVEEAIRIGAALARILAYAHSQGLIHRDVKPGNVLLEHGTEPVLLDFGLVQEPDADNTRYTRDSQLLGTPMYMAPELALEGPGAAGPASDQYAVGLILFEMLTGRHPFQAPTQLAVLQRALSETPPSMQLYGVPRTLDRVIRRALSRGPTERYADLNQLADALERHAELGGPDEATPPQALVLAGARGPSRTETPGWSREAEPRPSLPPSLPQTARSSAWWVPLALALAALIFGVARADFWTQRQREAGAETRRQEMMLRVEQLIASESWDDAESTFSAYTRYELNQETPALAQAWMWWGGRLGDAGRREEAIEALARAYAQSEPGSLSDTLPVLARTLWQNGEWDRLEATLDVMQMRAPILLKHPEMQAIKADLAVVHGDIAGALSGALREELRPLAQALSQATRTEQQSLFASPWRSGVQGERRLGLWRYNQQRIDLVDASDPRLPSVGSIALENAGFKLPIAVRGGSGPQLVLLVDVSGGCRLHRADGGVLTVLSQFSCGTVGAALAEPSGGGLLISDDRYLGRFEPQPDGVWQYAGAERSTNNSNSEIRGLEFADTNQDGEPELWVSAARWGAYDVRVLRPGASGYAVAHRRRLGTVGDLASIRYRGQPAIAVLQDHDPRIPVDLRAFGPDPPHGEAEGIHILRLGSGGIERLALLPLPPRKVKDRERDFLQFAPGDTGLLVGDLDGDGADEIVVSVSETWACIYTPRADGTFSRLVLDGLVPLALIDADADPANELVVRTADPALQLYVLGAGSDPLPLRDDPATSFDEPPESANASLRQRWRLAGDLVAMGFPEAAASRLEQLSTLARGTELESSALIHAARLFESLEQRERAAELYARVADDPSAASGALEDAFDAFYAARRFPQAVKVAKRRLLLPHPPDGLAERVARLESASLDPTQVLEFGKGELPDITVVDSLGLSPDVSLGGLRHRSAGNGAHWTMPLAYAGGPLRMEVSATLGRIDWGTGMVMAVGDDSERRGLNAFVWLSGGGGGFFHHRLKCPGQASGWGFERVEMEGKKITLRWEYDPADGMASCTVLRDEKELQRGVYPVSSYALSETMLLTFGVQSSVLAISELTLNRITMQGLTPRPSALDAAGRARRSQILGQDADALRAWDEAGALSEPDQLARALLLDGLGRTAARDAALRRLLATDPEAKAVVGRGLVLYPERLFPVLKALIGARAYVLLYNAMDLAVSVHEDRVEVQTSLTDALADVETLSPEALPGAEDRVTLIRILARGGGAWRRLGRSPTAKRLLERAWELEAAVRASLGDAPPELHEALQRELAYAARELALVQLGNADPDAAMDWLLRGVGISAAPELYADQCATRRDFALLHGHLRWPELEAARRIGVVADPADSQRAASWP